MKNTQRTFSLLLLLIGLLCSNDVLAQLQINRDNELVEQGETVCMDFVVENFDELIGVTFAVLWDPTKVSYQGIQNVPVGFQSGIFLGETEIDQGKLSFSWADLAGIPKSLPDGQVFFSVCFEAIGSEGDEATIRIGATNADPGIEILDKDGNNIGFSGADARIDILFSEAPDNALIFSYDDIIFQEGETFCVPFKVTNFKDMISLGFSMQFNHTRFRFIDFQNIENFSSVVFPTIIKNNANVNGSITYLLFDGTLSGKTLDDDSVLFEMCFEHILNEQCVNEEIQITSNPLPVQANDINDEEIPVFYEAGRLKIRTPIDYNGSDITQVTCANPDIGAISVDASGGTDGIKYLWSNDETTSTITGLTAGTYHVSISDICLAVDTIFRSYTVAVDGDPPTANAGDDVMFECGVATVTLDGSRSTTGAGMTYSWRGIDGQSIVSGAGAIQAEVNAVGEYEILVMDVTTGCTAKDTVEVIDLRTLPDVMAGEDVRIECDDVSILLEGTGATGVNIQYEWTTIDGNILDPPVSKGGVNVDRAGTYVFRVTDLSTGCTATDELIVSGGNIRPDLVIQGTTDLTCTSPQLSLDAASIEDMDVSYTWSTSDGSIVSGQSSFSVEVDEPGSYLVTAVNNTSGCDATETVNVNDLRTIPMAMAGEDDRIECTDDDITLSGTGSVGEGFQYSWTSEDGSIVSQTSTGQAVVNSAGTYTFTVLEIANGCSTSDDLLVEGDNARPQASISGNTSLNCNTTVIELNANNGGGPVDGLSYQWSTTDGSITVGENEVLASIDQPGTYTVRVTNDASGCADNSTVSITLDADEPTISAGEDLTINCSNDSQSITGTSDNMTNMNFQWNVIEGSGQIVSSSTDAEIQIMGAGKYELVVTNPLNGCSSRDTVLVSLNSSLPVATLGMDYDHCEVETILMGNTGGGVTGLWTVVTGGGVLEDPMDRNCRVNSLSEGINTFAWTLSADGCPDYSSDTININVITTPVAVDDIFNVSQGFGSIDIDLLSNDQFSLESGATIMLSSEPSLGLLTENGNGQFIYTLDNANAFGVFTFEYEICDDLCSLNCDTGMVTIDVRDGTLPSVDTTETNNEPQSLGITPNGDGLNDLLIFDELINDSDKYETKRLIVFNRWGDIVHEAQPYNNDWGGTNKGGTLLPQGTYYFVMQLDLGQGAIIEGDVTILQ